MHLSGGSICEAAYFWFVLYCMIWLPGAFWYRILGLQRNFSAVRQMLVLLLGTGFFSVCYCFAGRFGQVWLLRLIPLVLSAIELYFVFRQHGKFCWRNTISKVPPAIVFLFGFSCLIFMAHRFDLELISFLSISLKIVE